MLAQTEVSTSRELGLGRSINSQPREATKLTLVYTQDRGKTLRITHTRKYESGSLDQKPRRTNVLCAIYIANLHSHISGDAKSRMKCLSTRLEVAVAEEEKMSPIGQEGALQLTQELSLS